MLASPSESESSRYLEEALAGSMHLQLLAGTLRGNLQRKHYELHQVLLFEEDAVAADARLRNIEGYDTGLSPCSRAKGDLVSVYKLIPFQPHPFSDKHLQRYRHQHPELPQRPRQNFLPIQYRTTDRNLPALVHPTITATIHPRCCCRRIQL